MNRRKLIVIGSVILGAGLIAVLAVVLHSATQTSPSGYSPKYVTDPNTGRQVYTDNQGSNPAPDKAFLSLLNSEVIYNLMTPSQFEQTRVVIQDYIRAHVGSTVNTAYIVKGSLRKDSLSNYVFDIKIEQPLKQFTFTMYPTRYNTITYSVAASNGLPAASGNTNPQPGTGTDQP